MSESRKGGSKWDLKEERRYSLENVRDSSSSAKASVSSHDSERSVMKTKHGLSSRESLQGSRGGQDNDNINGECAKDWKTTTPWDGDEIYSMKKSPHLDHRRQQNRHHSPEGDWSRSQRSRSRSHSRSRSRSRSKSPVHDIRWQSEFHERTINKSGVSTQVCKDFMVWRCRRGSQCHFLHQDNQRHEDGWDSRQKRGGVSKYNDDKDYLIKSGRSNDCCTDYLKGNCRRGASCRFAHDGVSDGFNRESINDISRERENNKRNRVSTSDQYIEHEARKSSDIPCKYFASGNCRNGNYCRFSHHDQDGAKLTNVDASFNVEKSWNPSKGSAADVSNEAGKPWTGSKWSDVDASVDVENSWTSSKWSDTSAYLGATKLNKDTNGKVDASNLGFSDRSMNARWQHDYDVFGKNSESNVRYKRDDIDKEEGILRKRKNVSVNMGVSEPKDVEELIGDMEMSLEWNYEIHSSVNKEKFHSSEPTCVASLPACEKNITKKDSSQECNELAASQQMSIEESNFELDDMTRVSSATAFPCDSNAVSKNSSVSHIDLKLLPTLCFDYPGPSSSSLPHSNLNKSGQSELSNPSNEVNIKIPQNILMFQEEKPSSQLNIRDTNILHGNYVCPSTQSMVSKKQCNQLTNLSASLDQLFGKGQQPPSLHAAVNVHDGMQVTSFANSRGPIEPDSVPTVKPGQEITFPKQYEPISDSIEPTKKKDTNTKPLEFSVRPVSRVDTADGKPDLIANKLLPSALVGRTNGSDYPNDHSFERGFAFGSHKPNHLEPVASLEVTKENGVAKSKKAEAENKNGLLENIDADDKTEEGQKNKDGKEARAFKFALVEFVKDLLKPAWKEGQIDKEAYKSIVKKAVDKVTATMHGTNFPQTPEKIKQYLSFSKPKLSKLVQAYVDKFQKS